MLSPIRLLNQRNTHQRQRTSTTPSLLLQSSSERSGGEVPENGKINTGASDRSSEAPSLFPGSHHRSSNRISDEAGIAQTRSLRKADEVGHRAKRVRHQIQAETAIKGQVLADFVMEFAPIEPAKTTHAEDDLPIWKLSVDGASNAQGSGAGLILTSSEGIDIEYALRFGFHASNNEAEYEAVIVGLNLSHSLEVDQLEVYNNSQLVVRQIEDTYEAKSETMILYLQKVRYLLKKFVLV